MKTKKTTAKRVGAKRTLPQEAAKRPVRKVVNANNVDTNMNAESVTLLGDVARLYLAHLP